MVEILFSDSACGSLKMAQYYGKGKYSEGCTGVIISYSDGSEPTKAEIEAAQQEAEEKLRLAWENAVPLGGNPADIFSLNLALSIGNIAENHDCINRQQVLERFFSIYPEGVGSQAVQEILTHTAEDLKTIHNRVAAREPIRIWYSNQPDEMCGLYWFMSQLVQWDISGIQVSIVKLPEWENNGETVMQLSGWGEVSPERWHHYFKLQENIPSSLMQNYAFHWRRLQKENAPLRAVLNGKLISAPETLYDSFILRKIAAEGDEFKESNVIGRVLSYYQLGIGDAWIALRIDEMIQAGKLQVVSSVIKDMPIYHRILKKCVPGL